MYFRVLPRFHQPSDPVSCACLHPRTWDDYTYKVLYDLEIFDDQGVEHAIGAVRIGHFGIDDDQGTVELPQEFDELDKRFFSLGVDEDYYIKLTALGSATRDKVLQGLRDIAFDLDLFHQAVEEKVTQVALLRSVSRKTVTQQYARLARGGARLTAFEFSYTLPRRRPSRPARRLTFSVRPESHPPTNVHVLIGPNGVGKSYLLHHMARALIEPESPEAEVGLFAPEGEDNDASGIFANLVSISFSAFDKFDPLTSAPQQPTDPHYSYVGLKRVRAPDDRKMLSPKSLRLLADEFGTSVISCSKGARTERWLRAMTTLEADPIFRDMGVSALVSEGTDDDALQAHARKIFMDLSSGHKIVLLTVTRLVELVEEKTLVLLDEPEAHLHPPLLSSFVRALSDLLVNRNGVAILATHSPVALQEVPRRCVWKIRRNGSRLTIERPDIETFGENVGVLTREIFSLEVTHSGFHKLLVESIANGGSYADVLSRFGGELGDEAKAIVRALVIARDQEGQ